MMAVMATLMPFPSMVFTDDDFLYHVFFSYILQAVSISLYNHQSIFHVLGLFFNLFPDVHNLCTTHAGLTAALHPGPDSLIGLHHAVPNHLEQSDKIYLMFSILLLQNKYSYHLAFVDLWRLGNREDHKYLLSI